MQVGYWSHHRLTTTLPWSHAASDKVFQEALQSSRLNNLDCMLSAVHSAMIMTKMHKAVAAAVVGGSIIHGTMIRIFEEVMVHGQW